METLPAMESIHVSDTLGELGDRLAFFSTAVTAIGVSADYGGSMNRQSWTGMQYTVEDLKDLVHKLEKASTSNMPPKL